MMYTPSIEICEPFLLKEQNIRRIIEIIENRRPENAGHDFDPIITYKRLDDYEHETTNINDLFNEDNRGNSRIVGLTIESSDYYFPNKGLHYKVEFNSYENRDASHLGFEYFKSITYGVKGENKDLSELLFSDLDNYIKNGIIWNEQKSLGRFLKLFRFQSFAYIISIFLLGALAFSFFGGTNNSKQTLIENALSSQDITEKINTLLLLQQSNNSNYYLGKNVSEYFIILSAGVFFVFFTVFIFNKKARQRVFSLFPFVFDFGLYPQSYESRCKKLKTYLGILGALLLAIVGDVLYTLISKLIF